MATVEESVLKTEMAGLESQEADAPKRILFFKPMSWLGQIRPHRRDESWSTSLWQTFFSTSMGAQIPVIAEKPLAASAQSAVFQPYVSCEKGQEIDQPSSRLKGEVSIVETLS